MAIATDATADGGQTTGTSITWTHTCTGSNRILIVGVVGDVTNDTITGTTYAGISMTLSGKVLIPANRYFYMFHLFNPATGANSVTASSSSSVLLAGVSSSYTGVSSTLDAGPTTGTDTATTTTTGTLTVVANAWEVMFASSKGDGSISAGAGTTMRIQNATRGEQAIFDSNGGLTAGSQSLIASDTSTNWARCIISLAPSSVASKRFMTMFAGS